MKAIKVVLILVVLPFTSFSQNQEVKGTLTVESTTSIGKNVNGKFGLGTRLYLRGVDNSGYDDVWLAKYVEKADHTSLRINVGDDFGDHIELGITHAHTGEWYNMFAFRMNGNMGIGVKNPKSKLDVNGTIRAKEVKIESTGWADFVFKPEYQLPTLSEVENHILEHGHLPNIPSESEMKKNGVDVGEMQVKLLQKIEELTLYLIEQKKEIKDLKEEVKTLKNK